MKKRLAFVLIFIFAITNITFAEKITFEIYSVSDLHGHVLRTASDPGIAQLATFLKTQTDNHKERTLLLSGGDMSRNSLEGLLTQGAVVLEAFNAMDFDASVVGNHEFYWGLPALKQQAKLAKFPLLAANITSSENSKHKTSYIKPYVVLKKNNVKIGIIGIATLDTATVLPRNILDSIVFSPPAPLVQSIVDKLRQEDVNIIVVLSHLASGQDDEGNIYGDVADLANAVTGVDAIISAHSHLPVAGVVNSIAIVQASSFGQAVGNISLVYDTNSKKVFRHDSKILTLAPNQYLDDPKVLAIVDKYQKKILPLKSKVLGNLITTLDYNRDQVSPLGSWISDVLRTQTQADIAFYNASGIQAPLASGHITYEDLFATVPYDNLVCTIEMTGEEIIRTLELGLFNNNNLGAIQFSGLKVLTDNTKWRGNRVLEITLLDGSPLEMERLYRVATTDYLANGGDGLTVFTNGVNLEMLPKTMLDLLVDNFMNNPNISFYMNDRLIDVNNQE